MNSLLEQISQDLNEALKARDEVAVSTLRLLIAGLKNARIAKGSDLSDEEVILEISRQVKRHKESIEAFLAAKRDDLVSKEKAELEILLKYLPAPLSSEAIEKIVDEIISQVGAKGYGDMGRVMAAVMARIKGQAEGSVVSEIVKRKLAS